MIFLQLWWTLMVLTGGDGNGNNEGASQEQQPQAASAGSEELRNFHNALETARDQLREIKANYEQVQGAELYRHRRNSIDDLLASFAQAGDQQQDKRQQQLATDWLIGNFETAAAAEASGIEQTSAAAGSSWERSYGKAFDRGQTEVDKVKMEPQFEDLHGGATDLDIKLRRMQQRLHDQELLERRDSNKEPNGEESSSLRSHGNEAVPDDLYERTLQRLQASRGNNGNNLSHEANYKLSKIEQDAAEQLAARSRYPNGLKKRSSAVGGFDPINEIKLKTSNRLMRKGLGPSLPSSALTDSLRSHYVNSMMAQRERQQQELPQDQDRADTAEPMALPYETLIESVASPAESQLAADEQSSSEQLLDMPQSYDYRLANFERFPAVSRQRQSQLQLRRELERFKRHPEQQLNEGESNSEAAEAAPARAGQDSLPDAEQLLARLSAPLPLPATSASKEPAASVAAETKSVQADVGKQPQVQGQLPAKPRELQETAAIEGKLQREEPRLLKGQPDAVIKLLANKMSQHGGDKDKRDKRNAKRWAWQRVRRLKPDRSAAHYKRRSKRSLEQPLERKESEQPGSETPQLKERNAEAEAQAEAATAEQLESLCDETDGELEGQEQAQPQPAEGRRSRSSQLDGFEDHNGNRLHYGNLGNDLLLDPDEAAVEDGGEGVANLKEDEPAMDLASTDTNIFSSSRHQRPSPAYGPPQLNCNVNFTHLLNELAKLQQQQQLNANINQMKPFYGIHRVLGPQYGKGANRLSIQEDLCETAAAAAAPATVAPSSTLNPDCVPIPGAAAATAATTAAPCEAGDENRICSRPESVKLNVSLNANVCTDPQMNQFIGNGSISVQPSDSGYAEYEEERYLRQIREHSEAAKERKERRKNEQQSGSRRQQKTKAKAKSRAEASSTTNSSSSTAGQHRLNDQNDPYSEQYSKLISGKLSEDIVHAVLDMVSNDPSLDTLAAVLAKNRKCSVKSAKYFYQIRNDANEKQLEQTENLVRHTMETISDLIDKQMQIKNCIPLRPDLMEFYNLIMKTMAVQQKARERREATRRMLADDIDPEQAKFLQPTNIEQKSRLIKKLLSQYEELPAEQQQQLANVRDELLIDLVYLRKLSETLERNQRNDQISGLMQHAESEADQAYGEYTPRFLRLLKTAEIFREVGEQDAKAFIGY